MKIPNLFILNSLYNGDPKVTPLTLGWLEYTVKVKDVIVNYTNHKKRKPARKIVAKCAMMGSTVFECLVNSKST